MFQRVEKCIFLAFIFSLPFQKRTFLFGPALEGENFFEWGSGFVYFTDFLIAALSIFSAGRFFRFPQQLKRSFCLTKCRELGLAGPLLLLMGAGFISLTQADVINVGLYRFFKLAEFIFLFFYIVNRMGLPSIAFGDGGQSHCPKISIGAMLWTFIASGVFQSIIAILQFAKQSSLGLEIFHESTLAIHMKGVAHIVTDGVFLIRAYGTFPSPNVLAGFLGLCLLFLFYLFFQEPEGRLVKKQITPHQFCRRKNHSACVFQKVSIENSCSSRGPNRPAPLWAQRAVKVFSCKIGAGVSSLRASSPIYIVSIFFLAFGLILTFSRGTIIFFLLASAIFFAGLLFLKQFQQYRKKAKELLLLCVVCFLLCVVLVWPEFSSRFLGSSFEEPAIQERFFFNKVGIETMQKNPIHALFGIGIGNFVHNFMQALPGLPSFLYQPAHNIFILIASETGIFGFFAFALFIALLVEKIINAFSGSMHLFHDRELSVYIFSLLVVLCFIFFIGIYDHYFWTLQQGALMFWIVLGLMGGVIRKYN